MSRPLFVVTTIAMLAARVALGQSAASAPPFPPPGKLVDVGGWRLHLNCTGEAKPGQPTDSRGEDLRPGRRVADPANIMSQLQNAANQFAPRANEAPRDKLPPDAQRMRTWAYGQPKHWAQSFNPVEPEELAGLRAEREKTQYPYGDMPLVVLTRGISDAEGPDSKALEKEHRDDHAAVAKLSQNGKLIVAEKSGHHVQIDEPALVVDAIREVVTSARSLRR